MGVHHVNPGRAAERESLHRVQARGMMTVVLNAFALCTSPALTPFAVCRVQATCSRYALQIGALSVPLVKMFMLLLFPITKPIALVRAIDNLPLGG
jgi:putative component of membrane protein insertase Oxa1/YidC/SpoIIIJ protein YidD